MKQFNLEDFKAGKPVITREGIEVKQISYFENVGNYCIVAVVENNLRIYTKEGKYFNNGGYSDLDLFHPEEEMWVNVYKRSDEYVHGYIYKSKNDALAIISPFDETYIDTYKLVKQ